MARSLFTRRAVCPTYGTYLSACNKHTRAVYLYTAPAGSPDKQLVASAQAPRSTRASDDASSRLVCNTAFSRCSLSGMASFAQGGRVLNILRALRDGATHNAFEGLWFGHIRWCELLLGRAPSTPQNCAGAGRRMAGRPVAHGTGVCAAARRAPTPTPTPPPPHAQPTHPPRLTTTHPTFCLPPNDISSTMHYGTPGPTRHLSPRRAGV